MYVNLAARRTAMEARAERRLGSALHALRPASSQATDARSAGFSAGGAVDLAPDHPSFGAAPDWWKTEPDLESAARFTPRGVLTAAEQRTLRHELGYFREHGCIMIPDALAGEQLERGRTAYERLLAAARGEWEAADPAGRGPFAPDLPGVGLEINPIVTLAK